LLLLPPWLSLGLVVDAAAAVADRVWVEVLDVDEVGVVAVAVAAAGELPLRGPHEARELLCGGCGDDDKASVALLLREPSGLRCGFDDDNVTAANDGAGRGEDDDDVGEGGTVVVVVEDAGGRGGEVDDDNADDLATRGGGGGGGGTVAPTTA
jgi:hypothetical protein